MLDNGKIKPDFLIIGAPRAGTSWLWEMLKAHPDIELPKVKEPFFFGASEIYKKGLDWYFDLFKDIDPNKITGEGSTSNFYDYVPYFYNKGHELKHDNSLPLIPELICNTLPEVKVIICLRDPVDRAISHYGLWLGKGVLSPFANLKKIANERKKFRIIEYGYYAKYLETWKKFVPSKRMLIVLFEDDIVSNPDTTIKNVYEFLGVNTSIVPNHLKKKVNKTNGWSRIFISYYISNRLSRLTHKKPIKYIFDLVDKIEIFNPLKVSKNDTEFLRSTYYPEKAKLEKLIDRSLDNWKYGKS